MPGKKAKRKAKAMQPREWKSAKSKLFEGNKPISAFQGWDKIADITMQVAILQMKK